MHRLIIFAIMLNFSCSALFAQATKDIAPGAPGNDARWPSASATPLAWSMAQFIRLAINLENGHNGETPAIVAARYAKKPGTK